MNSVEKSAKTVDEAVELALTELGVERDRVDYEVIEQPTKAFLGFIGGKLARVKVTVKPEDVVPTDTVSTENAAADPVEVGMEFLQTICDTMKLSVTITKIPGDDSVTFSLKGNDLGSLIGKHGQTLDSLQYLVNLAANRDSSERVRIIVDVENYRMRRAETLTQLALRLADRVKRSGEKIALEPMNSHERKIIHIALQNDRRVATYSEGNDPYRKVVIALKK